MRTKNLSFHWTSTSTRTMFILNQNKDYQVPGAYTYTKIEEALKAAKERGEKELFVIGGGEVYK